MVQISMQGVSKGRISQCDACYVSSEAAPSNRPSRSASRACPPPAPLPDGVALAGFGEARQGLHDALPWERDNHLGTIARLALELKAALMQLSEALGDGK